MPIKKHDKMSCFEIPDMGNRGWKMENGSQKSEVGSQKSEDGRQKMEDRRWKLVDAELICFSFLL
jgi:hypothetical protein